MKAMVVYTSMTGNTEFLAGCIVNELRLAGEEVVLKEAAFAFAEELEKYDQILFGTYTWGDGDLPDESVDFYEEAKEADLSGKKVAVFGSGDSSYSCFAGAVDIWEDLLKEKGCFLATDSLKIDQGETEIEEKCKEFAKCFIEKMPSSIKVNSMGV